MSSPFYDQSNIIDEYTCHCCSFCILEERKWAYKTESLITEPIKMASVIEHSIRKGRG